MSDYKGRDEAPSSGTGSIAAVRGHPLHPMIVPIVIGMYFAATGADIALVKTGDVFWARSTQWLLLATLGAAALAVVPGMIDFWSLPRARNLLLARMHALGNGLFLIVVAIDYAWRQDPAKASNISGLVWTLTGLGLLGISGWLGGEMTYRFGIGVAKRIEVTEIDVSRERARQRLAQKFWERRLP